MGYGERIFVRVGGSDLVFFHTSCLTGTCETSSCWTRQTDHQARVNLGSRRMPDDMPTPLVITILVHLHCDCNMTAPGPPECPAIDAGGHRPPNGCMRAQAA